MNEFLLKSGMLLLAIAGFFVMLAFFAFALFSLLIIMPGLILYRIGFTGLYKDMATNSGAYSEDAKLIDVTPNTGSDIVAKGKAMLKSGVRKLRNFLNKYAD